VSTPAREHRGSSTLVLRPAPRREPPFDDEVGAPELPLAGPLDQRLPFRPVRVVRVPDHPPISPPGSAPLPEPAAWGRRLLIGIIETANGRRPLHQLSGLLSHSVATGLGADFERAASAGVRHWTHAARVRTVRASVPATGIAELCATVKAGTRVRAVALRLEARDGRWRCTRLQLG
jgi:hypothetical protein